MNFLSPSCPAEYLNALMMASVGTRGCGLGNLVYGGRCEEEDDNGRVRLANPMTMDSLRLAIPRNQYRDSYLLWCTIVLKKR